MPSLRSQLNFVGGSAEMTNEKMAQALLALAIKFKSLETPIPPLPPLPPRPEEQPFEMIKWHALMVCRELRMSYYRRELVVELAALTAAYEKGA